MIEALIRNREELRPATLAEAANLRDEPHTMIWVLVNAPTRAELLELQGAFHLHDLAIEDCTETLTKPGITDYDEHCFVTMHVPVFRNGDHEPDVCELNCFLGNGYIITSQSQPTPVVMRLFDRAGKDPGVLGRGADYIFYAIIDQIVDGYFDVLTQFDDLIDDLEEEILTRPATTTLSRVFMIKRQLIHLRRVIGPQREIFGMLNNREFPYIQRKTIVYFRDVYEHLIRVYELIESLRDLLSGALETYVSIQSNRLNEVMKALALVSTVLLPMNLIAGIYGMNFKNMPETNWPSGYYFALSVMSATGFGFMYWFKRQKWF